jgi:5-methylcytosine-specific restriction endonuclease McrA
VRPAAAPLTEWLARGRRVTRAHLKRRLLAAGLKENRCERCGVAESRGAPLALALHRINGINGDNRLENLQLLCPYCHSQTENFAGRNARANRTAA